MSAPRKIWASPGELPAMTKPAEQWANPKAAVTYHHDDVVRELVAALQEIKSLPRGEGGFCRPIAEAALAKIAQEG